MSDIDLVIGGDSSGAQTALNDAGKASTDTGEAVGKSTAKWNLLADAMKAAAAGALKFTTESVKAYAESERAQAQLARVAGKYTDVLSEQAEAMSKLYAVDDDIIRQSETLLVTWGGVGAATAKTEQAILDYAAATGKDAVSATQDLIRNVESGGVGMAKLGIQYEATGNKGEDLRRLTDALAKKFGGAAATDAGTLTGGIRAAELAFDDLKKTFGGVIASIEQKFHVLENITAVLRSIQKTVNEGNPMDLLKLADIGGQINFVWDAIANKGDAAQEQVDKLNEATKALAGVKVEGVTNAGGKANAAAEKEAERHAAEMWKIQQKNNEDLRKLMKDEEEFEDTQREKADDARKKEADAQLAFARAADQAFQQEQDSFAKSLDEGWKTANKAIEKAQDEALKRQEETAKKLAEQQQEQQRIWHQAGDAIGAAFVNALGDQLSKLSEGEEFDVGEFIVSIISAAVSVAATAIGTAYGQPALGAAVGSIASLGIKAGYNAISAKSKKPTKVFHEGGWVGEDGLPRYHSGAWIGGDEQLAILQDNERVLSRDEVAKMGGRAAVDSAARGGTGGRSLTINVNAVDAKSVKDTFAGDGSRGLREALRTGQGALPKLLGRNPR